MITKKLETLDLPLIQPVTNWFTGSYVFFDIVSSDAKTLAIASYDEKLFSVRNVATQKTQTISGRHVFWKLEIMLILTWEIKLNSIFLISVLKLRYSPFAGDSGDSTVSHVLSD